MLEVILDDGKSTARADGYGVRTLCKSFAMWFEGEDGRMQCHAPPAIVWIPGSIRTTDQIGSHTSKTPVIGKDAYAVDVLLWGENQKDVEAMRLGLRTALWSVCSPKGFQIVSTDRGNPNPQQSEKGSWLHVKLEVFLLSPAVVLPAVDVLGAPVVVGASNIVALRSPNATLPLITKPSITATDTVTVQEPDPL